MSLRQFLSILRARWRLAGAVLLVVVALAATWAGLRSPTYVARAPVLVDVRTDPVGATPPHTMVSPSYVATQIDIVKSRRVAERVIELLPSNQEPMLRLQEAMRKRGVSKQWMVDAIQRDLEVKPARESNIIAIAWRGRSPKEAAMVANAFAQAYFDTNLDLKTTPAKRYSDWFDEQLAQSRQRLERSEARLAEFQQKAGLISSNEQGDYERQRLSELTAQLIAAQTRLRTSGGDEPNLASSPVVNGLRSEVARLESKVNEASATLGSNHPKMQQLQAELGAMRSRLGAESSRAGQAAAATAESNARRLRDLEGQIAAQKTRVLASSRERGSLSVLQQEVQSAQKAYETVAASAAQARLQSMTTQGNVQMLGSASEPVEPSGPTAPQVLAIALAGGLLLGLATALLAELANRRVRSVEDLETATHLPIIGVVPELGRRRALDALEFAQGPRRLTLYPQGRPA
jgi:chain length determinant protein EpsF